jgi:hypothetical protein
MSLQNLENTAAKKILPRKILHAKELDIKIAHSKDLRAKSRPDEPRVPPIQNSRVALLLTKK